MLYKTKMQTEKNGRRSAKKKRKEIGYKEKGKMAAKDVKLDGTVKIVN